MVSRNSYDAITPWKRALCFRPVLSRLLTVLTGFPSSNPAGKDVVPLSHYMSNNVAIFGNSVRVVSRPSSSFSSVRTVAGEWPL